MTAAAQVHPPTTTMAATQFARANGLKRNESQQATKQAVSRSGGTRGTEPAAQQSSDLAPPRLSCPTHHLLHSPPPAPLHAVPFLSSPSPSPPISVAAGLGLSSVPPSILLPLASSQTPASQNQQPRPGRRQADRLIGVDRVEGRRQRATGPSPAPRRKNFLSRIMPSCPRGRSAKGSFFPPLRTATLAARSDILH